MANCPRFAFCHGGCRISWPLWHTSVSWPADSFKFNELWVIAFGRSCPTGRSNSVAIPSSTKWNPKGPHGKLLPRFLLFVDMLSQTAQSNLNSWSFFFWVNLFLTPKDPELQIFQSHFGTKLLLKKKIDFFPTPLKNWYHYSTSSNQLSGCTLQSANL